MKILFVCRGNVGRSQIAEALFRKKFADKHEVFSAGTKASTERPIGELSPAIDNVLTVMKEEGIDISKKVSKQITEDMANMADRIILVVDDRDPIPEYLINNPNVTKWDVLDPKGQDLDFTRKTREQIKKLIDSMGDLLV